MRALVVHNFYRSANASGENLSVRDEVGGLRRRGWDIAFVSTDSDSIESGHVSRASLLVRPTYSYSSSRRVRAAIRELQPDVALLENLFPLHSPWIIRVLHRAGVPVAAGVRSYRLSCAAATHFRDGRPCVDCLSSPLKVPAVRHACYQGSRTATLPIAVSQAAHRHTWDMVDRFLAVSDFVRDYLVGLGVERERVTVRPNFAPDLGHSPTSGTDFVFAGRLTEDKGARLLLDAWQRSSAHHRGRLVLAGSGPVEQAARAIAPRYRVEAMGLLRHDAVIDVMRAGGVVLMPSIWNEPFGRVVIEAASLGRAAIVTDRGALPSLVEHGVTGWVTAAEPGALARAIDEASDPAEARRRGAAARQHYERNYTEGLSLDVLDGELTKLALNRSRARPPAASSLPDPVARARSAAPPGATGSAG